MISFGKSLKQPILDYPKGVELPPEDLLPDISRERLVEIRESTKHMPRPRIWETLNRAKGDHANHQ
jgi:hypothetical protein